MISRRDFIKGGALAGIGAYMSAAKYSRVMRAFAAEQIPGLSDPAVQPKLVEIVPNALDPGFIYDTRKGSI